MSTNNASTRNECQAFGSIDEYEDHSSDKMKTNITQENVVARDQMSVGELRQWLAQFGNKQKDHYSNGYIKKLPQSYSIQERIQQAEAKLCTTSPSATSSKCLPLQTSEQKVPYNDSIRMALFSKTMSYHDSTEPTLTPKTTEAKISHHDSTQTTLTPKTKEAKVSYHDSIKLASSPVFRTFENYKNIDQAEDSPLTLGTKALENYRIVSIQKLLEPPQSQPRRPSFSSSWDDFDEFSEPGFNNSWHPNARQRSLVDDWSDHEDQEEDEVSVASGNLTDPGGTNSLSRQLTRRLKKSSKLQGDINKQKDTGMFRRKLPLLLCKSVKDNTTSPSLPVSPPSLFEIAVASAGEPLPPARLQVTEITARNESPSATHMYNASLFQGKTLTSNTLDLLCGSDRVAQIKDHRTSISDEETVSTWSEDSGQPSIVPGAIETRLGAVFAEETQFENEKIMSARVANRQITWPLKGKDDSRLERPLAATKGHARATAREAASVTAVVQRFGGAARKKTAIQQRKEELEMKWAADRAPSHVKKVKWQVCQRSGTYTKQICVNKEHE